MNHPHAHILQAIIDGKEVQAKHPHADCWYVVTQSDALREIARGMEGFDTQEFRIKPATVTINGVELEDDRITVSINEVDEYFVEYASLTSLFSRKVWRGYTCDYHAVEVGIAHHTKEGAIAFCKARLGIKD